MFGVLLQWVCCLFVVVCVLYFGVILVYYLVGCDLSCLFQLVGVFILLQGGLIGVVVIGQFFGELGIRGVWLLFFLGVFFQLCLVGDFSLVVVFGFGFVSNLILVLVFQIILLLLFVCFEEFLLFVGFMLIEFNMFVDLEFVVKQNLNVKMGGCYIFRDCVFFYKVVIIILFCNWQEYFKYWLYYLYFILQCQQLDYGIYVINQVGDIMFNCVKFFNVGF